MDTPKCLIDISGKTTLSNLLEILEEIDYSGTVFIVCGHSSVRIYDYINKYEGRVKISVIQNMFYDETNSLYSLSLVLHLINRDTVIMNGDLFFDSILLKSLIESKLSSVLADDTIPYKKDEMNISTDESNMLLEISKDIKLSEYSAMSLQIFKLNRSEIPLLNELIQLVKSTNSDFTKMFSSEILNLMIQKGTKILVTYITEQSYWFEIDNQSDYRIVCDFINTKYRK